MRNLTSNQKEVLARIPAQGWTPMAEIPRLGVQASDIGRVLASLCRYGYLRKRGTGRTAEYRRGRT